MSLMVLLPKPETVKIEMFHCTLCKQSFYYKRYLNRHMRRMHNKIPSKVPQKAHKCDLCEKSYSTKSYMYKHRVSAHGMSAKRALIKCQEENCNGEFSTLTKFRMHLDSIHNFEDYNKPDQLRFNSFSEYIDWLVVEEDKVKCKFIRPRGRFKTSSYTGIDYTCSQNRHFFSKSSERNTQDSKMTIQHCTAQILVKEYDDHVEALYFKKHYKHDFCFNHTKLLIRRKKTRKVERIIDNIKIECDSETNSLPDEHYSSQSRHADLISSSLYNSNDLGIEYIVKQLDTIRTKLLSKTSVDLHVALKISDSLKVVESLLDNDISPNTIKHICTEKKSTNFRFQHKRSIIAKRRKKSLDKKQLNTLNEIFVSTTSANDHDYNKM